MALSRRMFSKEFMLAAVQRLERRSSLGDLKQCLTPPPVGTWYTANMSGARIKESSAM
jgi:hypothetical protein